MRRLLLLFCLGFLVLTGCKSATPPTIEQVRAQWTERANKVISDPARAKQIAGLGVKLVEDQRAVTAEMKSLGDQMAALNADYKTTTGDFMKAYDAYAAKKQQAMSEFKDGVFAIRKQVTADEWKELIK